MLCKWLKLRRAIVSMAIILVAVIGFYNYACTPGAATFMGLLADVLGNYLSRKLFGGA
jgi:hypothetical protein